MIVASASREHAMNKRRVKRENDGLDVSPHAERRSRLAAPLSLRAAAVALTAL